MSDNSHHRHRPGRETTFRYRSLFTALGAMVDNRRGNISHRFRQRLVWIRIVMLGILLVDLALLAFANIFVEGGRGGYWPGMGAVFGGLLIGIIIIRIARPALYLDWIAAGVLQAGLGIILSRDPTLSFIPAFILFCGVFAVLAMLRLWIAATLTPGKGSASLMAGGLTSMFCIAWAIVDRLTGSVVTPDAILATDLMLTGASIIGFGLTLRQPPKAS